MKIKNRHRLKSKDIRNLVEDLRQTFSCDLFNEKNNVETGIIDGIEMVFVDEAACFFYCDNNIFFTLKGLEKYRPKEHFVVVDMGAVKFVTNGADVMTPGIVDADEGIVEGDQVWICDERNHKPLAVGIAILSGPGMKSEKKGKAITIIHYVGDKLWSYVAKSL